MCYLTIIGFFIINVFILINIFLAILFNAFTTDEFKRGRSEVPKTSLATPQSGPTVTSEGLALLVNPPPASDSRGVADTNVDAVEQADRGESNAAISTTYESEPSSWDQRFATEKSLNSVISRPGSVEETEHVGLGSLPATSTGNRSHLFPPRLAGTATETSDTTDEQTTSGSSLRPPDGSNLLVHSDTTISASPARQLSDRLRRRSYNVELSSYALAPPDTFLDAGESSPRSSMARALKRRSIMNEYSNAVLSEVEVLIQSDGLKQISKSKHSKSSTAHTTTLQSSHSLSTSETKLDKYTYPDTCFGGVRRFFYNAVSHGTFEYIIAAIILLSCISLSLEDVHLDSRGPEFKQVLEALDWLFDVLFLVEAIMKITAYGKGYVCDPDMRVWNILDFAIVFLSFVGRMPQLTLSFKFRIFRAFRPLRTVARFEGMKRVLACLFKAIPAFGNVLIVCMMIFLMFAIFSVQLFGGKLYRCVDANGERYDASEIANRSECKLAANRNANISYEWQNAPYFLHYDNVLTASYTLFQLATFASWHDLYAEITDVAPIHEQPATESSLYIGSIFVICFSILVGMFLLSLFTGVIIDTFNELRKESEGGKFTETFLSGGQQRYFQLLQKLKQSMARERSLDDEDIQLQGVRRKVYFLVVGKRFEVIVSLVIGVNMVTLAIEHYDQPECVTRALDVTNYIFTACYLIEFILKFIALFVKYFKDLWNVFDFLVLAFAVVDIVISQATGKGIGIPPAIFRVIRVLRIGRVLRLIRRLRDIHHLLITVLWALPAVFYVACFIFVLMFMWAVMGLHNYKYIRLNNFLDNIHNFQTLGNSLVTIFIITSGSEWEKLIKALSVTDNCVPDYLQANFTGIPTTEQGECGNFFGAMVYVMLYVMVVPLIVIQVILAVVVEAYEEQQGDEITEDDRKYFFEKWAKFDPERTQFIPYAEVPDLCAQLYAPLQLPKPNNFILAILEIPIDVHNRCHLLDVLQALARKVYQLSLFVEPDADFKVELAKIQTEFEQMYPNLAESKVKCTSLTWHLSTIRIQRWWRRSRRAATATHRDTN